MSIMSSCNSESDKLFWINDNTNQKSDLLYMAESTNVLPISTDSIKFYLKNSEIVETRLLESNISITDGTETTKPPVFKNFGKLHQSDKFNLFVIFRDGMNIKGRDYQFILRTYDNNHKIIDSYIIAKWNKGKDEYCFGELKKNLDIIKECDKGRSIEKYRILESGKFKKIEK